MSTTRRGCAQRKTATSTGVTEYILHGKNITHMTQGSHALHFYYDAQGKPGIVIYDGTAYGYLYNLQGDVVALVNGSGTKVVEYTYDAWGKSTGKTGTMAGTLGTVQPFRYRGYVWDEETGLYYLRSRYYKPEWCRFVSADSQLSKRDYFTGLNLFAYCGNNPVNKADPNGHFWLSALIVSAVVVACCLTLSECSAGPSTNVGAASPYIASYSTDYNCYAYVLGEKKRKYVGGSPDSVSNFDVDNVAEMVLKDAENDGRTMRLIDSFDSPIESNEYRIALRTGENDYHFMVQHNNGTWSHKPGICSTRLIEGANPSVVSWDAPQINSFSLYAFGIVREVGAISDYYDSKTIYFAVTK